jgi:hypothetical protein
MGVCAPSQPARHTDRQTDRRGEGREKCKSTYEYNPRHKQQWDTANMNRNIRLAHTSSAKKFHLHLAQALAALRPSSIKKGVYLPVRGGTRRTAQRNQSAHHDQPARNAVLGPNVQRRDSSSDRKAPFSSTLALAPFAGIVAAGVVDGYGPRWGLVGWG